MSSNVQVFEGVTIEVLGAGISTTGKDASGTRFSYIELSDGQMIRNVRCMNFLEGYLEKSLKEDVPIDLHVFLKKKGVLNEGVILAVTINGKTYGVDFRSSAPTGSLTLLTVCLTLLGFPALLFFGAGLLFWWAAYTFWNTKASLNQMMEYTESIPKVILLN